MSGMDDNVAVIGDWVPPSPSPRTFFSAVLGDDIDAKQPPENSKSEGLLLGSPEWMNLSTVGNKETRQVSAVGDHTIDSGFSMDPRSNSRGGLGERIAARAGFSAPKLNTEGIRPGDLSGNTEVRSPYLTIPPGLSPTTLLDSPVFLSNSLVQPSPTTGKFPLFPNNSDKTSGLVSEASHGTKKSPFEDSSSSSFAFQPLRDSGGSAFFGPGSKMTQGMLPQHSFPRMDASEQSESSFQSRIAERSRVQPQNGSIYPAVSDHSRALAEIDSNLHSIRKQERDFRSSAIVSRPDRSPPLDDQGDEEGDSRGGAIDPMVGDVGGGPAEDGYNWRKYGQKQVKGSEYPRSYYKCTHTECPVKKKVERSQEGHVTEIIYKGTHNHPKTAPNRQPVIGGPDVPDERMSEHNGDPAWANMQKVATAGVADWRQDNKLEVTSSPSEGREAGNPATSLPAQNGTHFEAADQADGSSTFSNDEGEDDQQTNGSVSMGYDGYGDESESKRRKIEAYAADMSGATRVIREPRVVVQTMSEVDILDDGYRWRKYGQKVVKGNPNPRSYYKCTSTGCTVRKHVERASHDLKSVITTYEGKHNHDVPASRNSSHVNSGPSGTIPSQSAAASAIQIHAHRPEPSQLRNMMARFDGTASLGSFNLPGGRASVLGPSHGFSFGMSQPGVASLGTGPGKLPMMPVRPFLMQQQQQQQQQQQCPTNEMDLGLMLQKGEAKVEPESSAVYQQMMNRLPLGHQM